MNIDISVVLWVLLGAYVIFDGLKKRKYKNAADPRKYTAESIKKFSEYYGLNLIILGVLLLFGAVIKAFGLPYILSLITVVLMIISGVFLLIIYNRVLQRN